MKKIVALVLSLVMVLGLATTAFAATPANYYAADDLETALGNANDYTYSMEAYTTGAAAAKTFDQVAIWETSKLNGAKTLVGSYVVATSADSADFAFINGAKITYLANATTYEAVVTALPVVAEAKAAKCGDVFVGGDVAAYTDANGVVYVETLGGTVYNVGGKAVALAVASEDDIVVADLANTFTDGTVYTVIHTYIVDTETVANKPAATTKVYCKECGKSFGFVEGTAAQAIAKFGAGNYFELSTGLFVALDGVVVADGAASEKVESAQTFDAGIAMYVGMSVMAAAGSAVVLKKKD